MSKFKFAENEDQEGTEIKGVYLLEIAYQLKRIADNFAKNTSNEEVKR